MTEVTFDASELRTLSADFAGTPANIAPDVRAAVVKGAVNIKRDMRADMARSKHFKGAVPAIDFDVIENTHAVVAVIGPKVGPGQSGGHAGIAYGAGVFGGARGGGKVRDPQYVLDEELPRFEQAMGDILEGIL